MRGEHLPSSELLDTNDAKGTSHLLSTIHSSSVFHLCVHKYSRHEIRFSIKDHNKHLVHSKYKYFRWLKLLIFKKIYVHYCCILWFAWWVLSKMDNSLSLVAVMKEVGGNCPFRGKQLSPTTYHWFLLAGSEVTDGSANRGRWIILNKNHHVKKKPKPSKIMMEEDCGGGTFSFKFLSNRLFCIWSTFLDQRKADDSLLETCMTRRI